MNTRTSYWTADRGELFSRIEWWVWRRLDDRTTVATSTKVHNFVDASSFSVQDAIWNMSLYPHLEGRLATQHAFSKHFDFALVPP